MPQRITPSVDWWAVTFGTARRGLGGAAARLVPSCHANFMICVLLQLAGGVLRDNEKFFL